MSIQPTEPRKFLESLYDKDERGIVFETFKWFRAWGVNHSNIVLSNMGLTKKHLIKPPKGLYQALKTCELTRLTNSVLVAILIHLWHMGKHFPKFAAVRKMFVAAVDKRDGPGKGEEMFKGIK